MVDFIIEKKCKARELVELIREEYNPKEEIIIWARIRKVKG